MTTFGTNMKLTMGRDQRDAVHRALTEGLGCTVAEPREDLVVFTLADGFHLGVYFVEPSEALTDAQLRAAPWLELAVDDVDATAQKYIALGATQLDYWDRSFPYLQLPGSPVFRLCSGSKDS